MLEALENGFGIYLWLVGPPLFLGFVTWVFIQWVGTKLISLMGVRTFVYLTFPGVMVHELGHAFMCKITGGTVSEMQLFHPTPDGTLGYVVCSQERSRPFVSRALSGLLVGMGPIFSCSLVMALLVGLLFGGAMLDAMFHPELSPSQVHGFRGLYDVAAAAIGELNVVFASTNEGGFPWYKLLAFMYVVFTFSSHLDMSPADIRVASPGLGVLFGMSMVLGLLLVLIPYGAELYDGIKYAGMAMASFTVSTLCIEALFFIPFAVLFWLISKAR